MWPNPRIPFRLSSDRPRLDPLQGKPLMVHVAVNIEYWPFERPMPRGIIPAPHGAASVPPDVPNYAWVEYGMRSGMPRLLSMLGARGLPGSALMNAQVADVYPSLANAVVQAGWELVGHGRFQQSLKQADDEAEVIRRSLDRLERLAGRRPRAWLGPGLAETEHTPDILKAEGVDFLHDFVLDDLPVRMRTKHGLMVALPYTFELNDVPHLFDPAPVERRHAGAAEGHAGGAGARDGRKPARYHPVAASACHRRAACGALFRAGARLADDARRHGVRDIDAAGRVVHRRRWHRRGRGCPLQRRAAGMSGDGAPGGLKVLDLTRVRAGLSCCRVLTDFGADVVKIDAPEGLDPNVGVSGHRHGYDMLNLHRNKRSMTLNLKDADGRALFLELAAQADVVVENFRPDVKDRLGIGFAALAEVNPCLILASISGFGQDGPYRDRAGFDQIAQGMGGLMAVTGHPGSGPMRAGTAVADLSAGLYAALGILLALTGRARSNRGQWVQTSLLQAQIALMDFQAARYLVDGEVPGQAGNDHPTVTPMGVVATADGHINLGVGGDGQWRAFCTAIGCPDWAEDPAYVTMAARTERRAEVWQLLEPIFAARTSAEWLEILARHGVPGGPIYRMDEVFDDPQVRHLGMAATVTHPARGEVRLVAQPVSLSRTPARMARAAPDPGAETDEILQQYGIAPGRIAALRARGAL